MGRGGEGERSPTKLSYEAARSSFVMREERVAPLYLPFVMRKERAGADDLNPNLDPNPNPISNPNPHPTPGP